MSSTHRGVLPRAIVALIVMLLCLLSTTSANADAVDDAQARVTRAEKALDRARDALQVRRDRLTDRAEIRSRYQDAYDAAATTYRTASDALVVARDNETAAEQAQSVAATDLVAKKKSLDSNITRFRAKKAAAISKATTALRTAERRYRNNRTEANRRAVVRARAALRAAKAMPEDAALKAARAAYATAVTVKTDADSALAARRTELTDATAVFDTAKNTLADKRASLTKAKEAHATAVTAVNTAKTKVTKASRALARARAALKRAKDAADAPPPAPPVSVPDTPKPDTPKPDPIQEPSPTPKPTPRAEPSRQAPVEKPDDHEQPATEDPEPDAASASPSTPSLDGELVSRVIDNPDSEASGGETKSGALQPGVLVLGVGFLAVLAVGGVMAFRNRGSF